MTPEERNGENNGEFNMAPRGSFNHLIESPACLGSPPSFAPYLIVSSRPYLGEYLRKGRRLLKDEFAPSLSAPSPPSPPVLALLRSPPRAVETFPHRGPFSSAMQYPVVLMAITWPDRWMPSSGRPESGKIV